VTEYVVITDDNANTQTIYGVLDADSDTAAGLNVLKAVTGDIELADRTFFYRALPEACKKETTVKRSDDLAGAGWFELAPTEPLPGGEPGGDNQVGDALSRRFAMRRPDGTWAVVTRYVYLAIPSGEPDDSEARVIETMDEFLVCKDLHDVGGTEFFSYDRYSGLPYKPTDENVRREALLMLIWDIAWDGQEFEDKAAGGLIR
jgi:hypothetical protein